MNKFKINTATQKAAVNKMEVVSCLLKKLGMSYQDWADLLFENGCRFIEKNIKINYLQIALLQNPALGFWDWWLIVSIEDDENLTSYSEVTSFSAYIKEKERMLHLMERVKQFDFFLIKNDKLNELAKV